MAERSIANEIKNILNAEKRQAKAEKKNDNLVLGPKYATAIQNYKWDKQATKDQKESAQLYDTLFGQRNRNMAEYYAKQQQELAPLRLKTRKRITLKAKGRSIRRERRRKNNTARQAKQRTSLLQKLRTLSRSRSPPRTASPPRSPSLAASPRSRSPRSRSPSHRSSRSRSRSLRSPSHRSPRSRSPSRQRSQSRKSKANSV